MRFKLIFHRFYDPPNLDFCNTLQCFSWFFTFQANRFQDASQVPFELQKPPKMAPKYSQDAPKTPPRAPKIAPRGSKIPPGRPKSLPRGRLHLRRRGQEAPRGSQEAPRGSQERILEPPGRILKPLVLDFGSKFPNNLAAKGLGGCREAQTILNN